MQQNFQRLCSSRSTWVSMLCIWPHCTTGSACNRAPWQHRGPHTKRFVTCISCQNNKFRDAPIECFGSCAPTQVASTSSRAPHHAELIDIATCLLDKKAPTFVGPFTQLLVIGGLLYYVHDGGCQLQNGGSTLAMGDHRRKLPAKLFGKNVPGRLPRGMPSGSLPRPT